MKLPIAPIFLLFSTGMISATPSDDELWKKATKEYEHNLRTASQYPFRKFEKAVEDGDLKTVARMLEDGIPADLQIPYPEEQWEGLPPSEQAIHKAARNGHHAIVQLLLDRGAKPDAPSSDGFTPLSQTSDLETAKLLLSRGANASAKDQSGYQPIHYAASESLALVRLLIENGANPLAKSDNQFQPIHEAAQCGSPEMIAFFLSKGARLDAVILDEKGYVQNGKQPLHLAVNRQDNADTALKVCQLLLRKGANIKTVSEEGETPLHLSHDHAITKLLIDHGAQINAVSHRGMQPIHNFALHGDTESIRLLLNHGADPKVLTAGSNPRTPLDIAVFFNRSTDTAKLLLEHGAKPTKYTLDQAERSDNKPMIRLIRSHLDSHPKRPIHRR